MVDFHSHILPNIDDGSGSVEQSIKMLKMLKENNVDIVAATPHFYLKQNSIEEFLKKRDAAYEKLMKRSSNNLPKIIRGAEVLLTSETAELKDLGKLCIENTNYILIEMPYIFWSDWVYQAVFKIVSERKLIPIIAHIERYKMIIKDFRKIHKLLYMDVIGQINADSIVNWRTRGFCFKLIKNNMCHIIASDCHDDTNRVPKIKKAQSILNKKFGSQLANTLCDNAKKIAQNDPIDKTYLSNI